MLAALKVAGTRSRYITSAFDSVFASLRQKEIDCAAAREWLREEGLLDHLPVYGRPKQ